MIFPASITKRCKLRNNGKNKEFSIRKLTGIVIFLVIVGVPFYWFYSVRANYYEKVEQSQEMDQQKKEPKTPKLELQ